MPSSAIEQAEHWLAGPGADPGLWHQPDGAVLGRRTADWLARLGLDEATRAAALVYPAALHAAASKEALHKTWGEEVATLLEGFQRLDQFRGRLQQHDEGEPARIDQATAPLQAPAARVDPQQVETLRRMVLALSEDIRVVLARLASHLVRLERIAEEKAFDEQARRLGEETLQLQAPLANRLGVWQLKWAMEDLAFRLTRPDLYKQIAGWLDEKRAEREAFVAHTISHLSGLLKAAGIQAEVAGRPKHIYSIYNKMRNKALAFDQLRDLRAFRIIVSDRAACFDALAVVHAAYPPMDDEFDDYITRPKPNGYQSLHTVLLDDQGRPFEVQIRTQEMHVRAEYGVAAHWKYKESGQSAEVAPGGHEAQIQWLRQMLAWGQGVGQVRLSDDRIYVLTPRAKIIELAAGATPLDFAYALHTELGHRCRGAKVNGQIVPLTTPLLTGQTVELLTAKTGGPSRDWLLAESGHLKTTRARQKVRAYFNALEEQEQPSPSASGASTLGQTPAAVNRPSGATVLSQFAERGRQPEGRVLVVGIDRMLTSFAKCCRPVPPDAIHGFVTRGKGVSVHRQGCPTLARLLTTHPERGIETSWGRPAQTSVGAADSQGRYGVALSIRAQSRDDYLRGLTDCLLREKVPLLRMMTQREHQHLLIQLECLVLDLAQLDRLLGLIRQLPGSLEARRD